MPCTPSRFYLFRHAISSHPIIDRKMLFSHLSLLPASPKPSYRPPALFPAAHLLLFLEPAATSCIVLPCRNLKCLWDLPLRRQVQLLTSLRWYLAGLTPFRLAIYAPFLAKFKSFFDNWLHSLRIGYRLAQQLISGLFAKGYHYSHNFFYDYRRCLIQLIHNQPFITTVCPSQN